MKKLHLNKPQLRSLIIGAPTEYLVAGRGTGKSEGVLAPKTAKCYFATMPRGTGVCVGATYNQLLTRTLPALIAGWGRLGYNMGQHYLIGRKPTDKWIKTWRWKGPYRPPLEYKYFISWWNGAGAHLVSQDRTGSANGITIDWIIGDEAKLLNSEKLKTELFPANRGIIPEFNKSPYHHGMTFTTDMPVGTSGRWILDMSEKMDKNVVKEILQLQKIYYDLQVLQQNEKRKTYQEEIQKQLDIIDEELFDIRKGLLYYHEASTIDNIHALGLDYIKQQIRDTSSFQFDTQILNHRPIKLEDGFYPDFDEEYHGYFAVNNSYLDNLDYDFSKLNNIDCRRDSDVKTNEPLHIAIDYNRRIHPLVVGQVQSNQIKILNGLHAMYPQKLIDVLEMFVQYYKPHKRKFVYYWYDHTAVGDQHQSRICDDVQNYLRKNGWLVRPMYTSKAPSHEVKYRMYGDIFTENDKYKKVLRINRENCDKLILSMCYAQAELRKDGFGKEKKKPESDPKFPADEAPHYSDALDMLMYGLLESKLPYGQEQSVGTGIVTR